MAGGSAGNLDFEYGRTTAFTLSNETEFSNRVKDLCSFWGPQPLWGGPLLRYSGHKLTLGCRNQQMPNGIPFKVISFEEKETKVFCSLHTLFWQVHLSAFLKYIKNNHPHNSKMSSQQTGGLPTPSITVITSLFSLSILLFDKEFESHLFCQYSLFKQAHLLDR